MTKKLYLPLVILMLFSMIFSACAPAAPATEAPAVEEPAATVEEAPVVEEPVMEEVADLDGVFGNMLANMTGL